MRYYDGLALGWTQADPMYRFAPDAAWAEPRRAGLYQFVLGNPVRYVDPDGRAVLGGTLMGAEFGAPLGPAGMAAGAVVGTVAAYMVGNAIGHSISNRLHSGGGTIPMKGVMAGASAVAAVAAHPTVANIANMAQGQPAAPAKSKTTTDVTDTPAPTEPPGCEPNQGGPSDATARPPDADVATSAGAPTRVRGDRMRESATLSQAIDQHDSIAKAQQAARQQGVGDATIESIKKSAQNVRTRLKQIRCAADVEDDID